MNITEFAVSYKERNYPHDPKMMDRVIVTDVSTSVLVWSEEQFLVEMYMMHPSTHVVKHSHPFENVALFISGSIQGFREGGALETPWMTDEQSGYVGQPLPIGKWHEFNVGPKGAVFYNISCWENSEDKDSAIIKYIGEPLGPIHEKFLASVVERYTQET